MSEVMLKSMPHFQMPIGSAKCGATCLRMVYYYFKKKIALEPIWESVKSYEPNTNRVNCRTCKMVQHALNNGFFSLCVSASDPASLLETCLKNEIVPIILYRPNVNLPYAHFSVVVGKDDDNLYINDPENDPKTGRYIPLPLANYLCAANGSKGMENCSSYTIILIAQSDTSTVHYQGTNSCTHQIEKFDLPSCLVDHPFRVLNPYMDCWIDSISSI